MQLHHFAKAIQQGIRNDALLYAWTEQNKRAPFKTKQLSLEFAW